MNLLQITSSQNFPAFFQGNRDVTISGASGSITALRTTAQLPAVFSVSASGITATGADNSFEDPEYSWDFGDPSGTETFFDPYSNTTVNANNAQTGPGADYTYRRAGTYTCTLTVRWRSGGTPTNPTLSSATFTIQLTAAAFDNSGGEIFFDSTAISDGIGTSGSPYKNISHMDAAVNTVNCAVNVKCGSDYTGSTGIVLGAGPLRIRSYGSGAKPILGISSGAVTPLKNNGSCSDIVLTNLVLRRTGGSTVDDGNVVEIVGSGTDVLNYIYFDNVDVTTTISGGNSVVVFMQYDPASTTTASRVQGGGFWGGTIKNSQTNAVRFALYGAPYKWFVMFGLTEISGKGTDGEFDHHVYPNTRQYQHYRYVQFSTGLLRSYCINTNYDRITASLEYAEFVCISNCLFTGVERGWDAGNGPNDETLSRFRNFVSQLNRVTGLNGGIAGNFGGCEAFSQAETMTTRDSLWYSNPADGNYQPGPCLGAFKGKFYRNKMYVINSTFSGGSGGDDTAAISYDHTGFVAAQTITDNVIYDTRTGATVFEGKPPASLPGTIDRNSYYYPNNSSGNGNAFWNTGVGGLSFASWQALGLDTNGTHNVNPGWNNPAIGDFST